MSTNAPAQITRGETAPLVFLTLAAFLLNTSEFVPIGLLTDIASTFSLTESGAGLMISIYAWAVAALSLPLMIAASRMPPKRLILVVLTVFCAGQVGTAVAPTFELLVAARLVVAAAHAVFWSVASPYAVRVAAPEHASRAMSMIVTGTSVAMIFGLPLGRALGLALGWRMTFVVVGAVTLAVGLGLAATFPSLSAGEPFTLRRLPELGRNRALLGIYLLTILYATGYYVAYSYIEPFLAQASGMSDDLITIVLSVFGVAGLAGSWLFARFFDAHRRVYLRTTMIGLALALLMLAPVAPWAAATIGVCVIWGACSTSFNAGAQAEVIRVTNEEQSAVAMSIFSGLFNVGIGGGSIIGGVVCDTLGVGAIGLVGGIVAVAGALWCALVLGRLLTAHGRAN